MTDTLTFAALIGWAIWLMIYSVRDNLPEKPRKESK